MGERLRLLVVGERLLAIGQRQRGRGRDGDGGVVRRQQVAAGQRLQRQLAAPVRRAAGQRPLPRRHAGEGLRAGVGQPAGRHGVVLEHVQRPHVAAGEVAGGERHGLDQPRLPGKPLRQGCSGLVRGGDRLRRAPGEEQRAGQHVRDGGAIVRVVEPLVRGREVGGSRRPAGHRLREPEIPQHARQRRRVRRLGQRALQVRDRALVRPAPGGLVRGLPQRRDGRGHAARRRVEELGRDLLGGAPRPSSRPAARACASWRSAGARSAYTASSTRGCTKPGGGVARRMSARTRAAVASAT